MPFQVAGSDKPGYSSSYIKMTQMMNGISVVSENHPVGGAVQTVQQPAATLSLSEEALKSLKETMKAKEALAQELEKTRREGESFMRQLESAKKQGKATANLFEIQRKCLMIAIRIRKGDIVPKADHRFLAGNQPELYKQAILMRESKENPEKHKRLSKDEDKEAKKRAVHPMGSAKHGLKPAAAAQPAAAQAVETQTQAGTEAPDVSVEAGG